MHSKDFDTFKRYYELGLWTEEQLRNAVLKGRITEAEFEEITGHAMPSSD